MRRLIRTRVKIVLGVVLIPLFLALLFNLYFFGKIHPGISVAGTNLSDTPPEVATSVLSENVKVPEKIVLKGTDNTFELSTKDIDLSYDFISSVQRAFDLTRTGNLLFDLSKRFDLFINPQNLGLVVNLNEDALSKFVSVVAGEVSLDPVYPTAKIQDAKVIVDNGRSGTEIDKDFLRALIGQSLALAKNEEIIIPLKEVDPSLSDSEAALYKERAEKIIGKEIVITFEFESFKLDDSDIVKLMDPLEGLNKDTLMIKAFEIAEKINRDPQNPKFSFTEGRVTEFLPAKDGVALDGEGLEQKLNEGIATLSENSNKTVTFEAPVKKTPPETTTDKVNNLGINELIGRGSSRFRGSIPSRVHNVQLAASRLNGILIKPGDVFSFNDALGDVSKFTGYQEAYVIKEGKTVLGDGGGVCQVSTTFFRAALNAGLPITERQAHAYRVGYYEQDSLPGLDATVYGPSPDLKIKNDTPAHILVQATADTKNYSLVFEFYGTSDGRIASVSKPITTSVTPAGEDIYIDDPALPVGTVKQTEHKANGARVTFNYLVSRDGEEIYKKTFISNYRPWQAVYLRGVAPVQ